MFNKIQGAGVLPGSVTGTRPVTPGSQDTGSKGEVSFGEVLKEKLSTGQSLKISGHAASRLQARNMQLSPADLGQLEDAVRAAGEKGARESLVVYKDQLFVVSVENSTVITALGAKNGTPRVFTNIDSAVVI